MTRKEELLKEAVQRNICVTGNTPAVSVLIAVSAKGRTLHTIVTMNVMQRSFRKDLKQVGTPA